MVSAPSLEQIIAFKPSSQMEDRLAELMAKNKQQDALSQDERHELVRFCQLNHFVNMLKIRARKKIAA